MHTNSYKVSKENNPNFFFISEKPAKKNLPKQKENSLYLSVEKAVRQESLNRVKLLLNSAPEKTALFQEVDKQGNNLLHIAIINNRSDILAYLINTLQEMANAHKITEAAMRAIINTPNKERDTPLALANKNSYKDCVKLLKACQETAKVDNFSNSRVLSQLYNHQKISTSTKPIYYLPKNIIKLAVLPMKQFNAQSKLIDKEKIKELSPGTIMFYQKLMNTYNDAAIFLTGGAILALLTTHPEQPNDFDLVTTASMKQIQDCFPGQCVIQGNSIGKQSLVVTIEIDGKQEEIDVVSLPAGPEAIHTKLITNSLGRDYRVNSFFYNLHEENIYFDPLAQKDLIEKKLCTIIDPNISFSEDPVRILRGIRLAARYGFVFDHKTIEAIFKNVQYFINQNPARLHPHLTKLFKQVGVEKGLYSLQEYSLLAVLKDSEWARASIASPLFIPPESADPSIELFKLLETAPDNIKIFKSMISDGVSIRKPNKQGKSLLTIALEKNLAEHASLLILNGSEIPDAFVIGNIHPENKIIMRYTN